MKSDYSSSSTTVVALGGNALGQTPDDQLHLLRQAAPVLVSLADAGPLVIAHGNGPQVGQITRAFSLGVAADPGVPDVDLPEMVAMSQGYIGEHLVRSIDEAGATRGYSGKIAGLLTRVEVDPNDPAFADPTKPIGQFLTREMAEQRMKEEPGSVYREDAGRGFRKYVASPLPRRIVEIEAIQALANAGFIVIASGGGGIPVIRTGYEMKAVDAVIDKDRSAALMADELGASALVILTAVPAVATGWGTPMQHWLHHISLDEGRALIESGELAEGSMRPKVEAIVDFVSKAPAGTVRRGVICALADADRALSGEVGTTITSV